MTMVTSLMELVVPGSDPCPLASIVLYHAQRAMKNLKRTIGDVTQATLKAGETTVTGEVEIAKHICTTLNLPIYPEAERAAAATGPSVRAQAIRR